MYAYRDQVGNIHQIHQHTPSIDVRIVKGLVGGMRLYRWCVGEDGGMCVRVEDSGALLSAVIGPFGPNHGWFEAAREIIGMELRARAEEMGEEAPRRVPGYLTAGFAILVLLPALPGHTMTSGEVGDWIEGKVARIRRREKINPAI